MCVNGSKCVYLQTALCVLVKVFKYACMPFVAFVIASERVQAYAHVACSDSTSSNIHESLTHRLGIALGLCCALFPLSFT